MSDKLRAVADIDIPFLKGVLDPFFEIRYLKGNQITASDIQDSSLIVIRTRTKCDAKLLDGSAVKLIASATIGMDHIDLEYCLSNGIQVVNAAGCNAAGVAQFVVTALFAVAAKKQIDLKGKVVGIIGAGNTGERSARLLSRMGFRVMRCDPPIRERLTSDPEYYSLQKALCRGEVDDFYIDRSALSAKDYFSLSELSERADIISLHLPLDSGTTGLISSDFMKSVKNGAILMNSSRGEVIDESALLKYCDKLNGLILDVWNNEPDINRELLDRCDIATMHIAGYSIEGKMNGTMMVINKVAKFFNICKLMNYKIEYPTTPPLHFVYDHEINSVENINLLFSSFFPIFEIDSTLRNGVDKFEEIRSNYRYRAEFTEQIYDLAAEIFCDNNMKLCSYGK